MQRQDASGASPQSSYTANLCVDVPETYQLWQQLEKRYDITIRGVQPAWTVEEQAQHAGAELWKSSATHCCELRKLTPLRTALEGFTAWITAIRRDQTPDRATAAIVEPDP